MALLMKRAHLRVRGVGSGKYVVITLDLQGGIVVVNGIPDSTNMISRAF